MGKLFLFTSQNCTTNSSFIHTSEISSWDRHFCVALDDSFLCSFQAQGFNKHIWQAFHSWRAWDDTVCKQCACAGGETSLFNYSINRLQSRYLLSYNEKWGKNSQELGKAPGLAVTGNMACIDCSVWPNVWRHTHQPFKDMQTPLSVPPERRVGLDSQKYSPQSTKNSWHLLVHLSLSLERGMGED